MTDTEKPALGLLSSQGLCNTGGLSFASSSPPHTLSKILGNGRWFPTDDEGPLCGPVLPPRMGPQPSAPPTLTLPQESALGPPLSSVRNPCECRGPPGLPHEAGSPRDCGAELAGLPHETVNSCRQG